MADKMYDLIVLGGGPGGYTAAIRAAQLGMKPAVVERERLGGICLNWGCIPTKALLRNAEVLHLIRKSEEWGISVENVRVDFSRIIRRSRGIAERISKGVEYLMKKNAIDVIYGSGTLTGPGSVTVTGGNSSSTLHSPHIILATGARPKSLPGVTIDRTRVITSTEAMTLAELPSSLIIVGAGAIGIEFAYFYNAMGTKVTVLEMMPSILPVEDRELTKSLESSLKKQGIDIRTETHVENVTVTDTGVNVSTAKGAEQEVLTADLALMATGVQGNVEGIGLEQNGVVVDRGHIKVDEHYQTSVPGVYAIGDVIGPPWLAHVASAEGIHCVEQIAGKNPPVIDYSMIPGCTYCQPQVASIGLTEEKARATGHEVKIGKVPFRPFGKAMAIGETEGMVKLIFDAKYGELLGAHLLGSDATEMIHELVLARKLEGTGMQIMKTVHAHPTLSEAVMEAAAAAYGEAINL